MRVWPEVEEKLMDRRIENDSVTATGLKSMTRRSIADISTNRRRERETETDRISERKGKREIDPHHQRAASSRM